MSTIKNGGPAFPVEVDNTQPDGRQTGNTLWQTYGMSLRDYFAANAMQGWVSASPSVNGEPLDGSKGHAERIATISYVMADAMLKAREGGAA